MTNEEAKIAMFGEQPVRYHDLIFDKIISLNFRKDRESFISLAEVIDNTNTVYRLPIKRLELAGQDDMKTFVLDLDLQEQLLMVDQQLEYVNNIFIASKYEECSMYTNRLLELLIDFSNSLENKIKEKLNKKEPSHRP